jgi:hypothetical protein
MRKSILYSVIAAFVFTFSSCSKEGTTLANLHGTWRLTSQLDNDGLPVDPITGHTYEYLVTFFLCDKQDQDDCYTNTKVTDTYTSGSTTSTTISSNSSSYAVFGKTQLLWSDGFNDNWEIETITKKSLVIHPTDHPKATRTYEKQK